MWAKVLQTTGVNLVRTPQLSRLVSTVLAVAVSCFLCYIDYQPWLASLQQAQDQAPPSRRNNFQFSQQPDKISDQEDVEAIPMYVEELLLLLTCYVEGTS